MKRENILRTFAFIISVFLCIWYLKQKNTYTSYTSEADGTVDSAIANWNIKIDKETVTTLKQKNVAIKDIEWDESEVAPGKVAPGSKGKMHVEIDPTGTEVALLYTLQILDNKADKNMILTVENIKQSNAELIKTGENEYTSVITLDMLKNKVKPVVEMDLKWENNDDINDLDRNLNLDKFLKINFLSFSLHNNYHIH